MPTRSHSKKLTFPVVAIGASAGGLDALKQLFSTLGNNTGMAFVVIQHLDPKHGSMASEILARSTEMTVKEIRSGQPVKANTVYAIPSNCDLWIKRGKLGLLPRKESHGQHMVIDTFFKSLASDMGSRSIGVILSGTATDGTLGLKAIKDAGGIAIAQDPGSSKFDGMPRSAISSGVVDLVLPPAEIAQELMRMSGRHRTPKPLAPRTTKATAPKAGAEEALLQIFSILHSLCHVDFSHYKRSTLRRRIQRRMMVRKTPTLAGYAQYLAEHPDEAKSLYDDLLINVTEFFRDSGSHKALSESVFPKLLKNRPPGSPIRIWVAGCATGEEAYSIAMAFLDCQERAGTKIPIQIFATDISEPAIQKARSGVYGAGIEKAVGKERLKRYFERVDAQYKIQKSVRDICLFSRHDITCDPPFSRLDLISCRNVLIYFDTILQKRVIPVLHYALNPGGFLWLGRSESPGENSKLFNVLSKAHKIYTKANVPTQVSFRFPAHLHLGELKVSGARVPGRAKDGGEVARAADRLALLRYAPPSVIVNADLEILQFRGRTAPFLEPAAGTPSLNLLRMARPDLIHSLRLAIQAAKVRNKNVRQDPIQIDADGKRLSVSIDVVPVNPHAPPKQRNFLVFFDAVPAGAAATGPAPKERGPKSGYLKKVRSLERELLSCRQLQDSMAEEFEATQEELTSANEELQSTNEELQSTNEELETAKEELQSSNEELTTVNDELRSKNADLTALTGYLNNILSSVQIPIVIVGSDHRIHRFTPGAEKAFKLIAGDIGRPVGDIKPNFDIDLDKLVTEVIRSVVPLEREVRDDNGQWMRLQIRPYKSVENRIEGAVIALVDIQSLKQSLDISEAALLHSTSIANAIRIPFAVLDVNFHLRSTNNAFNDYFGAGPNSVGAPIFDFISSDQEEGALLAEAIKRSLRDEEPFKDLVITHTSKKSGSRLLMASGQRIQWLGAEPAGVLVALEDVTERKKIDGELALALIREKEARNEAERANAAKDLFLATLSHELRTPLNVIQSWVQMLINGNLDASNEKKAFEMIAQNGLALEQLINDLLDVSRIIMGKLALDLRSVDPAGLIPKVVDGLKVAARNKSVQIKTYLDPEPVYVSADPVRLRQIVWNLLNNAIKFSNENGVVEIHVHQKSDRGVIRVVMSVIDYGIGISPTFLPLIFERFSQEDSSKAREHGGLGLGLAIVRNLVELQGGTIRAESAGEGQGATFIVDFPTVTGKATPGRPADEADGVPKPDTKTPPSLGGMKVLLVDDDPDTREVLCLALKTHGAEVKSAASVRAALDQIADFKPRVVISDIAMPGEDGYTLIRKIRGSGLPYAKVPAMALSAYADSKTAEMALNAGFTSHMSKPINVQLFINTIFKIGTTGLS